MITSSLLYLRAVADKALAKNDNVAWRLALEQIKVEMEKLLATTKKGW